MRLFFALAIICVFSGCHNSTASDTYQVVRIDSVGNYLVIYANKNDSIFKVITKKVSEQNCRRIKINGTYDFRLKSIFGDNNLKLGDGVLHPKSDLHVGCISFDSATMICYSEKGIVRDLFFDENMKGSCFE
jgi:hypothetical protein